MSALEYMDGFLQNGPNVATILGFGLALGSVGVMYGKRSASSKSCSNLATTLTLHRTNVTSPILRPPLDPYKRITDDKALIIEGPNKVGKTAMFALSIPWWRRDGPFKRYGFVLNGAEAATYSDFEKWRNNQMRGTISYSGAEIPQALEAFKEKQFVRAFLSKYCPFIYHYFPFKRPYIIVDQFEQLIKKYPVEALAFANNLTNDQVRNSLAYVFFVVNSPNATKALLNLNQGVRFDVVKIDKTADSLLGGSEQDNKRFATAKCNIGLFKDTKQVPIDDLEVVVKDRLEDWKRTYHLDYSPNGDASWKKVDDPIFRAVLAEQVATLLKEPKIMVDGKMQQLLSDDKVNERIKVLHTVLEGMTKEKIRRHTPLTQWIVLFKGETTEAIATELAEVVMKALSSSITPPVVISQVSSQ
jgi:hypothetical protein